MSALKTSIFVYKLNNLHVALFSEKKSLIFFSFVIFFIYFYVLLKLPFYCFVLLFDLLALFSYNFPQLVGRSAHLKCSQLLFSGSDDNAALYWLGRMLKGGEDPTFIARRLVRYLSFQACKPHRVLPHREGGGGGGKKKNLFLNF